EEKEEEHEGNHSHPAVGNSGAKPHILEPCAIRRKAGTCDSWSFLKQAIQEVAHPSDGLDERSPFFRPVAPPFEANRVGGSVILEAECLAVQADSRAQNEHRDRLRSQLAQVWLER